jgi:hypothetical protein
VYSVEQLQGFTTASRWVLYQLRSRCGCALDCAESASRYDVPSFGTGSPHLKCFMMVWICR